MLSIKDNHDMNNNINNNIDNNNNNNNNNNDNNSSQQIDTILQPLKGDKSGGGWDGGRVTIPPGQTVDLVVVFQPKSISPLSPPPGDDYY